jgi:hypothetical protein
MLATLIAVSLPFLAAETPKVEDYLGRWDIMLLDTGTTFNACWWKIEKDPKGELQGQVVWRWGSVEPAGKVELSDGEIRIVRKEGEKEVVRRARIVDGKLLGEVKNADGTTHRFEGRRAPDLSKARVKVWGQPIPLFDGKSLAGWKRRNGKEPSWAAREGTLVCKSAGENDLLTEKEFGDFKLHLEYNITKGGNSGVYLRGRYEVQLEDNGGKKEAPESHSNGAIYSRIAPTKNVSLKAGEWQTLDIVLVGRMITVIQNGEPIIENGYLDGITGGAKDSFEGNPGPIMLQGDHGDVQFRNIILTPAGASPSE